MGPCVKCHWVDIFLCLVYRLVRNHLAAMQALAQHHGPLRSGHHKLLTVYLSRYPQLLLNWTTKSVKGLSYDMCIINFVSFGCYTAFNCVMFWSASVRAEYECASRCAP